MGSTPIDIYIRIIVLDSCVGYVHFLRLVGIICSSLPIIFFSFSAYIGKVIATHARVLPDPLPRIKLRLVLTY